MDHVRLLTIKALFVVTAVPFPALGQTIAPSPFWKNEITYPDEPFRVIGTGKRVQGGGERQAVGRALVQQFPGSLQFGGHSGHFLGSPR